MPPRLIVSLFAFATSVMAQTITFTVSETEGLRRFGYPVTVSLESIEGMIADAEKVRLITADGKEMPAQFTAMSNWPRMCAGATVKLTRCTTRCSVCS